MLEYHLVLILSYSYNFAFCIFVFLRLNICLLSSLLSHRLLLGRSDFLSKHLLWRLCNFLSRLHEHSKQPTCLVGLHALRGLLNHLLDLISHFRLVLAFVAYWSTEFWILADFWVVGELLLLGGGLPQIISTSMRRVFESPSVSRHLSQSLPSGRLTSSSSRFLWLQLLY